MCMTWSGLGSPEKVSVSNMHPERRDFFTNAVNRRIRRVINQRKGPVDGSYVRGVRCLVIICPYSTTVLETVSKQCLQECPPHCCHCSDA
jgi:hypothetical protein